MLAAKNKGYLALFLASSSILSIQIITMEPSSTFSSILQKLTQCTKNLIEVQSQCPGTNGMHVIELMSKDLIKRFDNIWFGMCHTR